MRKLLHRPSPAMVVACVALLVALGGTSMAAASQLGRNSVGTLQLQFGAVTNPKIRNNAVNSAKVATARCCARTSRRVSFPRDRPARRGRRARKAPPAQPGLRRGRADHRSLQQRRREGRFGQPRLVVARIRQDCDGNERAISAGTSWGDDGADLRLVTQELEPQLNAQNQVIGFVAVGGNDTGESSTFTVYVLCYTP